MSDLSDIINVYSYEFIVQDPLIQLFCNLIYQLELLSNINLSFVYSCLS